MKVLHAITGASGVVFGKRLLEVLSERDEVTVELVISDAGRKLIDRELPESIEDIGALADERYGQGDLAAPPASGSTYYDAMAVVPCSVSTLSHISSGIGDNLITRAAAVMMKERRKMVIVPRETPLSTVHLEHMMKLSREGVVVLPAMPAFYGSPESIEELIDFLVGKILDQLGLENELYRRWEEVE